MILTQIPKNCRPAKSKKQKKRARIHPIDLCRNEIWHYLPYGMDFYASIAQEMLRIASKLIKDATGLPFEPIIEEKKGWQAYVDDPAPFTLCLWYNYHNDNQWRYDIK